MIWVQKIKNHFFLGVFTIFLFFILLASLPERTLPSWHLRLFIFTFSCFSLLRILFFFARTIMRGFSFFFSLLVDPPFFSFGLCLNFYFDYFTFFFSRFSSPFDIL